MDYKKIIKYVLIVPLLVGAMELIELVLPLQKVTDVVTYKNITSRKGNTNYNIEFGSHNDQFTETIYNSLNEGDEVELEVSYFSKEVRSLVLTKTKKRLDNDTIEIYIQTIMALVMFIVSILFIRKEYLNSTNFKIALVICVMGIATFIRIISIMF